MQEAGGRRAKVHSCSAELRGSTASDGQILFWCSPGMGLLPKQGPSLWLFLLLQRSWMLGPAVYRVLCPRAAQTLLSLGFLISQCLTARPWGCMVQGCHRALQQGTDSLDQLHSTPPPEHLPCTQPQSLFLSHRQPQEAEMK